MRGGDGARLASVLRELGFIVEEVYVVPDKTHERRISLGAFAEKQSPVVYARLPARSRFFARNHRSLASVEHRPSGAQAARLLQSL